MALFAVLPVTQRAQSLPHSNSLFHQSRSPSQSPDKIEPEHHSSTMAGNSSRPRPTKTTVTPVTPARSRATISKTALNGTPQNHGSGSRPLYRVYDEPKKDEVRKQYDAYLHEDLLNYRVYISFESALQNILHVPKGWKEDDHEYRKIINQVAKNDEFQKKREVYLNLCNGNQSKEEVLYDSQAELYNKAISLINSFSVAPYHKRDEDLLHFRVNHLVRIAEGIFTAKKGLSPDLTGTMKKLNEDEYVICPMIVHVEEMKDSDATLDKGNNVPRAACQDEGDPWSECHSPARKRASGRTKEETQAPDKKRRISSDQSVPSKAPRVYRQRSTFTRPNDVSATSTADPKKKDNNLCIEARLQCARYLMEMLEFSVLRSHALVTLVDRNRMQLMYADRSAIVTSSIIDLQTDNGLDQFLAMLIAFHRLSPKQWGFLSLVENPFVTNSYDSSLYGTGTTEDKKRKWLHGSTMRLQREGTESDIKLKLGDVLYHQPGIIGRGTCVIEAKCESEWTDQELVVKISWPSKGRQSEVHLLSLARKKGEELVEERKKQRQIYEDEAKSLRDIGDVDTAKEKLEFAADVEEDEEHWALRHLPNIFHSQDVDLDSEPMPQTKLADFFAKAKFFHKEFVYEIRGLRAIVQEKLQKLTNLSVSEDYAQAFYDVFLCHRWLHDYPRILHRDISAGNIMYRIVDGKVHGVLNDLDLSSLREDMEHGTPTSQQRTGTPPYMALELLQAANSTEASTRHLYRHDMESLIYVILTLCCRYELNGDKPATKRLDKSPFEDWFNPDRSWHSLSITKKTFVEKPNFVDDIHSTFMAFIPWLDQLLNIIREGFAAKSSWDSSMMSYNQSLKPVVQVTTYAVNKRLVPPPTNPARTISKPPPFDMRTHGGHVVFSDVAWVLMHFRGVPLQHRAKDILHNTDDAAIFHTL